MTDQDTSPEAVGRMAARLCTSQQPSIGQRRSIAATLRALSAERDALRAEVERAEAALKWSTEYRRADLCDPQDERVRALEAENARLRSALSIYSDVVSDYARDCELASDPAYDWLQEDGGDVARAALRALEQENP